MNKKEWKQANSAFIDSLTRDIRRCFTLWQEDIVFTIRDLDLTKPLPKMRIIIEPEKIDAIDVPYTLGDG